MKFKNIWAHVFMCLISLSVQSKVLKYDVYQISKTEHSLKEVCQKILNKDYPLVTMHSISQVDCMSKIVDVNSFCKKMNPSDLYLIRGIVFKNKAFCQSAKRVILKYACNNSNEYCKDSSIGCYKLKSKLAIRLDVIHSSIMDNKLNCYYAKNIK